MAKRTLLALAVLLGACFGPSAPLGAPCAMNNDCPAGQACDPETRRCEAPNGVLSWFDDLAENFATAGAVIDGAEIERGGFVGPTAYFAGGLRLSGVARHAIDAGTTWIELSTAARTGTTVVRTAELSFAGTPPGLGLPGGNDITILVEGEIYLETPGQYRFQLDANDLGFVDLAPPGGATFERIIMSSNNPEEGFYDVVTPGWHRLRGAAADRAMNLDFALRYDPPGPGNLRTIPAADLRAPTGDIAGVVVDGFEDPFLIGPRGTVVYAGPLVGQMYEADPYELVVGNNSFSLRFSAQVLVDVEGSYALRVDTGQGHRVWLDGILVADRFGGQPEVSVTPEKQLEPGWHDLVIDLHRINGAESRLDLTVASGPVGAGQPIPPDHLRPIVGRATRWAGTDSVVMTTIADGMTSTRNLSFGVPRAMVVSRIDAAVQIEHPMLTTMQVRIGPPSSGTASVIAAGSAMGTGTHYRHVVLLPSLAGTPASGSWNVNTTDTTVDMMTGSLNMAAITLLGAADPPPFPPSFRYISAPRDLGGVATIARVKWALRQERPEAKVTVAVRTCEAADACDAEPWTEVTNGAAADVPPRRFAQYKVELTGGGGEVPTALDWIELRYRPE